MGEALINGNKWNNVMVQWCRLRGRSAISLEPAFRFVGKHLHELKSSMQPDFSVHYIDYPGEHRHVLDSKEHFDEVCTRLVLALGSYEKTLPPPTSLKSSSTTTRIE